MFRSGNGIRTTVFNLFSQIDWIITNMATQDDVNALAEQVATATANIRQDIADIQAANPDVDLSSLRASVDGLSALDAENPGSTPPPVE